MAQIKVTQLFYHIKILELVTFAIITTTLIHPSQPFLAPNKSAFIKSTKRHPDLCSDTPTLWFLRSS